MHDRRCMAIKPRIHTTAGKECVGDTPTRHEQPGKANKWITEEDGWELQTLFFFFSFFLISSLLVSRVFYPQRSSGQAVVTLVVPSSRRSSIFHRMLLFITCYYNLRSLSFDQFSCTEQSLVRSHMHSPRLEPAKVILVSTRTTYQGTGEADVYGEHGVRNKGCTRNSE